MEDSTESPRRIFQYFSPAQSTLSTGALFLRSSHTHYIIYLNVYGSPHVESVQNNHLGKGLIYH